MNTMRILMVLFSAAGIIGCASAPKINLTSGDIAMELNEQALVVKLLSIAYAPDGKSILAGAQDNSITLWDIAQGRMIKRLTGHEGNVTYVAYSPDGKSAVSAGCDGTARYWDLQAGKEILKIKLATDYKCTSERLGLVNAFNGKYLAVARGGQGVLEKKGPVDVYDIAKGEKIRTFEDTSYPVAFSPDSGQLMTGKYSRAAGHSLLLWDVPSGKLIKSFHNKQVLQSPIGGFSPDGKKVFLTYRTSLPAFDAQSIVVWDVSTGNVLKDFTLQKGYFVNGAQFSTDGRHILTTSFNPRGYQYMLWDTVTGALDKVVSTLAGYYGALDLTAVLSPDGRYMASNGDAAVRQWDVEKAQERATLIAFQDGEWLVSIPEGYYNASEKGANYLSTLAGGRKYSVDQFYDVFYRPDIVAAKLGGEDISGLVTISMKDAIKSPPPIVDFAAQPANNDQAQVKVCCRAKSSGGGIGEVRLFQNGKLVQSDGYYRDMAKTATDKQQVLAMNSKVIYENMRSVKISRKAESAPIASRQKGESYEDCAMLEPIPGENEVSISAFNRDNTVQSPLKTIKFISMRKPDPAHLYVLAIGIDQYRDAGIALKYAAKDAKDVEEKLRQQSLSLYDQKNIHYALLTNEQATKGNILSKIAELSRTIKATDSFILFVAGHGVLLQDQYYMLTHDYNGTVADVSLISSNEIVEMSKKIKSLSQLFIFDTCHAGGMDAIVRGLYDARMSVLAKKMGLHIYASANSVQEALDGYQGNGLFSHVLLQGLSNNKEADKNNDGKVSLVELGEYAKTKTMDISKGLGHTQTPFIINFGKDSPLYSEK